MHRSNNNYKRLIFPKVNFLIFAPCSGNVSAYRRAGESAFAKHYPTSSRPAYHYSHVEKQPCFPRRRPTDPPTHRPADTPIRRYADTPIRRYVSPSLRQRLSVLPTDRLTSAATPACDLQTRLHRICLSFS